MRIFRVCSPWLLSSQSLFGIPRDCKYRADEFNRRCRCRKHFRWTQNKEKYRKQAGTRSREEAEQLKRRLEDQMTGRISVQNTDKSISGAIEDFIKDKGVQGVSDDVLKKYTRLLARLESFCVSKTSKWSKA